jgi:hypothetical protein
VAKLVMIACAAAFYYEQNKYFGWNTGPRSDTELIADGITLILFALMCLPFTNNK